jgi:hypothetical protein
MEDGQRSSGVIVLGVLKVQGTDLDIDYLRDIGRRVGLTSLLERALVEAGLEAG